MPLSLWTLLSVGALAVRKPGAATGRPGQRRQETARERVPFSSLFPILPTRFPPREYCSFLLSKLYLLPS